MPIKVNLVGAGNFINNLDGIKYTSRNSAGELIDYEVSEAQANALLAEKSEFGAPYFLLAAGSDVLEETADAIDDGEEVVETDAETQSEEKKTVKTVRKIGGTKKAVEV